MDSWLADKIIKPDERIYIDIKSRYSDAELQKIQKAGSDVRIVSFPLTKYEQSGDHTVPFRNLFFAAIAAAEYMGDINIYLAANAGDEHVGDKSPEFAKMASKLLTYISQNMSRTPDNREIKIILPFSNMTKAEVLAKYIETGGDLETAYNESFSCYEPEPNGTECWNCQPCFRKAVAFTLNGYEFTDGKKKKLINFYERKILPDWNNWSKYHKKEAKETLIAIKLWTANK